jgi:hypothetical protein
MIKEALKRKGQYYYLFPEYKQGRRVIWDGMDNDGFSFLDHIPPEARGGIPNQQEMKIRLSNNSIVQIIGTDDYDKMRGSNPVGMVFSEYAYQNPAAYDVASPILLRNGGWAAFNSTPFGKNHFYDMENMLKSDPDAFVQVATIADTYDWDGNPLLTEKDLDKERKRGKSEEFLQQEYYCDYTANAEGFYYLKQIEDLRQSNRIGDFPWVPDYPVFTYWDIGVGDSTAIWFLQAYDDTIYLIDFYKNNSVGIDHYSKVLLDKPYAYQKHTFPHDMINTEFGTGRTRFEMAEKIFGRDKVEIGPKMGFEDGIQATRAILPRCKFNEEKCKDGIKALENYHRKWDDTKQEFMQKPVHDWSSHPADAFRYMAVSFEAPRPKKRIHDKLREYRRKYGKKSWMAA